MKHWLAVVPVGVVAAFGVVWDDMLRWPFGFGVVAGLAYLVGRLDEGSKG